MLPTPESPHPLAGMEPWLWALQDANEAESRGDAAAALAAIRRRPFAPEGGPFWSPSRVYRLHQLDLLGELTPGWAVSRWILAQALHYLDEAQFGLGPRSRSGRAAEIACELRGPALALPEVSDGDRGAEHPAQVSEHDWVYRQAFLFELGGLDAFLADGVSADLVSRADRIRDWALAPMGGYTFLGSSAETSLWLDKEDQAAITLPNIGSAVHLLPGSSVIGRLVPTDDGRMFESAPLPVTGTLARAIALDPPRWLDLLRDSGLVRDKVVRTDTLEWTGLMSDIPIAVVEAVLWSWTDGQEAGTADLSDVVTRTLFLAREVCRASTRDPFDCPQCLGEPDDLCPECGEDDWDAVSQLHAALLDPVVLDALPDLATEADEPLLHEVCDVLAEPARSWLGALLDARRAAA